MTRQRNLAFIITIVALLLAVGPFLPSSVYAGSPDLHAAMEMLGAIIGIMAGISLIVKFYALGNRFHLLIGLAFLINGTEDLAHGLLSFDALHRYGGIDYPALSRFIPGTYVAGRFLMSLFLIIAPFSRYLFPHSDDPQQETKIACSIAFLLTILSTYIAFLVPLPEFIFPENLLSRPVDFLTAALFALAFALYALEYKKSGDRLVAWITLSIGINMAGQALMGFSKALYDPFFDIAHLYKILGYCTPLLGFSIYQVTVIQKQQLAELQLVKEHENFMGIFSASPVGLLLLDDNTMIVNINKTITNLVLREPAEIIGERGGGGLGCAHSLETPKGCGFGNACPECPLRRGVESVLEKGKSIHDAEIELPLIIDGKSQKRWLSVSAEPLKLNDRQHVVVAIHDITARKRAEKEKTKMIAELEKAAAEIKTLKGIVPICMYCKEIRDDKGYWNQLEKYISEHSDAQFSHGICDKCLKKHYQDE